MQFRTIFIRSSLLFGAITACSVPLVEVDETTREQPAPIASNSLCVLSADCGEGLHCDLGECIQSCNSENPCDAGKTCSARARCLAEGEPDVDPAPATENRGSFEVLPTRIVVQEGSKELRLKLKSETGEPVRYRLTSQGSFVDIQQPRGEFSGETDLALGIDLTKLENHSDVTTLKIFTDRGERVVQVVAQRVVTGKYQGALRYRTHGVDLGDARIALELIERNGDVDVRIDPETSLLFPATSSGAATGIGRYSKDDGLELDLTQALGSELGGARNHFARALGRKVNFRLHKNDLGTWEGTFREKVYGLFPEPVELEGTVSLYYRPGEEMPNFELTDEAPMPAFVTPPMPYEDVFGENTFANCNAPLAMVRADWGSHRKATFAETLSSFYRLDDSMRTRFVDGRSYADLLDACKTELRSTDEPENMQLACGWLPAVACATFEATGGPRRAVPFPREFNSLFAATAAPALLVAQEHAVRALDASFAPGGLARERTEYDLALAELAPVTRWLLHPTIIGYLRSLSNDQARENAEGESTYPAGRALAQLLRVLATVDGERTRLLGLDVQGSDAELVHDAQERSLVSLYEAALLLEITRSWGIAPELVAANLSGFLGPLDSGFGALLEGARAFGVPEGFVPFVWRPEDVGRGADNFEQMLSLSEDSRVAEAALEQAYLASTRNYEDSESEMLREALSVRATYDQQIIDICGAGFDLDKVQSPQDWEHCGNDDSGELGILLLDVAQAEARIASAQSRALGMRDKISIDTSALAARQNVRRDTLNFIDSSNRQINALTTVEGALDVAMEAIAVAANSSLFNGGAPAAMAAASIVIGIQKVAMGVAQDELRQAQEMKFAHQEGKFELIDGMAAIQKQTIDAIQLTVEMTQDNLAKQQAIARANNLIERARGLHSLRTEALDVSERNPSHDPTFRLLRDSQALSLVEARTRAQRNLFFAGRALEYEVNTPLGALDGAVEQARGSLALNQLASCLNEIRTSHRIAFGGPQKYATDVSVRQMLGIVGPRTDEVTGQVLGAGEQFRMITQRNQAFDDNGSLTLTFSTNLQPGNGLWSADVCGDRISNVQVQLVGDNLGDDEAQANLTLSGAAVLRACDSDDVRVWSMAEGTGAGQTTAVVQAGVNSFGTAGPNGSLYGQAVARASWQLTLPSGEVAPANADLDLSGLEDIVLRVEHSAAPRRATPLFVNTSCLANGN